MEQARNMEETSLALIVSAGEARSSAFTALKAAREGDFEKAHGLMGEADERILEAHKIQTDLLMEEGRGKTPEISILLIHAQDHLMTAMLAMELIEELIGIHKKLEGKT